MANEELREVLGKKLYAFLDAEDGEGTMYSWGRLHESLRERYRDAAEEIVRPAVAQAYEEAAQAGCRYCRLGLPAVAVTGSSTLDLVPLGETYYVHRVDGTYLHGDMRCESHHIRVLKDLLVQEPASSSL